MQERGQQQEEPRAQLAWMKTAYEKYMEEEGIPVYDTMAGVHDVAELPRQPWARTGGLGTFILMLSTTHAERGIYVAEIPGGGALNPEKHLFEEVIHILKGRGITEVWQEGKPKVTFEWGEGSLFAPPLNSWHRLINGTREPVVFLAVTTAPQAMEPFHDTEFIFNCDRQFLKRFSGEQSFFTPPEEFYQEGKWHKVWDTHFIPDVREAFLMDEHTGLKVSGGRSTPYRMGTNFPNGYMGQWPVGRYHKAHHHGSGAILVGLKGKGYAVLWPKELGIHPYQDGHGDQVMEIEWGPRAIYTPPEGWFHQHMNTGKEPARQFAIYKSLVERGQFMDYEGEKETFRLMKSVKDGGNMIEYEDEDPEIRRRFVETLSREGVECTMPEVVYQ